MSCLMVWLAGSGLGSVGSRGRRWARRCGRRSPAEHYGTRSVGWARVWHPVDLPRAPTRRSGGRAAKAPTTSTDSLRRCPPQRRSRVHTEERPRRAGRSPGWRRQERVLAVRGGGGCHPDDLPGGLPHGAPGAELSEVGRRLRRGPPGGTAWSGCARSTGWHQPGRWS